MNGRYLLFSNETYEAKGGGEDYKGCYDTIEKAQEAHNPQDRTQQQANIFDVELKKVVQVFGSPNFWMNLEERESFYN
jgi:hypothetical protein